MIFKCPICQSNMDYSILEKTEKFTFKKTCMNKNCNYTEVKSQFYSNENIKNEISSSI